MSISQLITAILIHLIVPLLGLTTYIILSIKMKNDKVYNPPYVELFIVFMIYGGLFLLLLTALFWHWSGMASLGTFFLVIVAPVLMMMIAFKFKKQRKLSIYHNFTLISALSYFIVTPIIFLLLFIGTD